MKRVVKPELLDELPPNHPLAVGSRRDLCRVNAWMQNHALMTGTLQNNLNGCAPKQITELGAGDGHFLLRVAQQLSSFGVPPSGGPNRLKPELQTTGTWNKVSTTLLDRQKIVAPEMLASFASLGWRAEIVTADVFDWLPAGNAAEVIVANLFLHHFDDASLAGMFRAIAGRARLFIAIEPRRSSLALFFSRLLWAIGCNRVTRHDAVVSVRAGFFGHELSTLWPADGGWQLTERQAGSFSHLFVARRSG